MIADRHAYRAEKATGDRNGQNRGQARVNFKMPETMFEQIRELALATNRSISGQVRALLEASLEPK